MSTTVICEALFEAAHWLPGVPEGHKCRRLHGHSFRCELHVTGPVDAATGFVVDFDALARLFEPLRAELDHHVLNDVEGLSNPTSENLAAWIWQRLAPRLPGLSAIVIHESDMARCLYTGP